MQVGFIGTGSMGKMLIEAFIHAQTFSHSNIHASNRTQSKANQLAYHYPGIHVHSDIHTVVQNTDLTFICVKPNEYKAVIDTIAPYVSENQIIASITSSVEVHDLEQLLNAKIVKIIPSITNAAASGSSLLIAGSRLTESECDMVYDMMQSISKPVWINEAYTRVCSDIVSCGPAFISYLLQRMIQAAVTETDISEAQATELTANMMIGFGELLAQETFTLESLKERVCVPGGITGAGIEVLEKNSGELFEKLFQCTHKKYAHDLQTVYDQFYKQHYSKNTTTTD